MGERLVEKGGGSGRVGGALAGGALASGCVLY